MATERSKKTKRSASGAVKKPWQGFDRKATARNVFNLRLNDYYFAILKHLAEQEEDLSMHKVLMRILRPELERLAGIGKKDGEDHGQQPE